MILLADTMVQILAAGGGLNVSTKALLPDTMIQMAAAAARSGSQLIFRVESVLLPDTMIQVGAAGRGRVTFEIPSQP
jgi:hypothetical protein